MISADVFIWIKALSVIAVFSFFYRENIAYRFIEYTAVAGAVGVYTVNAIKRLWGSGLSPALSGDFLMIVPVLIGALLFFTFNKKYKWVTRYPLSIVIGIGFGLTLPVTIQKDFIGQIAGTILSITTADPLKNIGNIILITTVICVLYYFIFTREPSTMVESVVRKYARIAMMIGFAGLFAMDIMTRMASFLSILQFVVSNWLGLA